MTDSKPFDRRSDISSKLFVGIMTAILTAVFLGALGISVRASEINNMQEVRLSRVEYFMENQNRLNEKLEKWIDQVRYPKLTTGGILK